MERGKDIEQVRRPHHSRCDWGPDTFVGDRNDPALGQYLALKDKRMEMEYTRINTLYNQLSVLCGTAAMSKELIDEVHGVLSSCVIKVGRGNSAGRIPRMVLGTTGRMNKPPPCDIKFKLKLLELG